LCYVYEEDNNFTVVQNEHIVCFEAAVLVL